MKYTIIHVNDRAIKNIEHNKKILKDLDYISDISFFNGNIGNAWDTINHRGIRTDVWKPYDGRSFPPLPGEYGIWESTLRVLEYIVENSVDRLLVLEDDIRLNNNARKFLDECLEELPEDFDIFSLYSFVGQNALTDESNIGAKNIHRSINQPSGAQAIMYSFSGAKKLLKLIRRKGIEYTSDCFIFEQARLGSISGYSIIPEKNNFLVHEYHDIKSLIDPDNIRQVEM